MPMPDQHQWISYLPAFFSTTLAGVALWLSARQSRTNMAKLRLDLYDKRFAVYESTLAFYQALGGSAESLQGEPFTSLHRGFIKAFRESQFLFDDDSGVFELLKKVSVDAFKVIAAKTRAREVPGEMAVRMVAEANDTYAKIEKAVDELERVIAPYIRFSRALI
ncbi:MAG TPA: hypothetical protein VHK47_18235 [Polyangia bacterium]|nr:hypothetical protein [Polyangia bacterium]